MGLDMYLTRKKYISFDDREKLQITGITGIRADKVKYIEEEAGYWRKANMIHKWFVDNIQEGEDDCKEYYVDKEQLQQLLDLVNKVLDGAKMKKAKIKNGETWDATGHHDIIEDGEVMTNPELAEELLPVQEGFFFGGTNYDQYYIADLKDTKKILEKAIALEGDYYYSSSW